MYPLPHLSEWRHSLKQHWYASHIKGTGTKTLEKVTQSRKALMRWLAFSGRLYQLCHSDHLYLVPQDLTNWLYGCMGHLHTSCCSFWNISKRDWWGPQSDHYQVFLSGTTSSSSEVRFSGIPEGRWVSSRKCPGAKRVPGIGRGEAGGGGVFNDHLLREQPF